MSTTEVETIKAARIDHRCSWCPEIINAGTTYKRWRYFGSEGATVCKLHPECEAAMHEGEPGGDEWPQHSNPRGCWCGFDAGCQKCTAQRIAPPTSDELEAAGQQRLIE